MIYQWHKSGGRRIMIPRGSWTQPSKGQRPIRIWPHWSSLELIFRCFVKGQHFRTWKMDVWNTIVCCCWEAKPLFKSKLAVSFKEGLVEQLRCLFLALRNTGFSGVSIVNGGGRSWNLWSTFCQVFAKFFSGFLVLFATSKAQTLKKQIGKMLQRELVASTCF